MPPLRPRRGPARPDRPAPIRLILAFLVVTALTGCAAGPKWAEIDIARTPAQERYPDADAVVLFDKGSFEFEEQILFTRHVAIKILNPSGLKHANVDVDLSPGDEVDRIEGRTIRRDGSVVELKPSDVHEVPSFPDFVLYSEARALVFAMPGVQVGSVIEYKYTLVYASPYPPVWRFQCSDDTLVPVLHSRFTFEAPQEIDYRYLLTYTQNVDVSRDVS